jgi:hypothetical protein
LFDNRENTIGIINQRIQIRLGENFTEHFQALFAAAHAGEPIVNQRDLHRCSSRPIFPIVKW